jgi:hypothetical protein
MDDPADDLLDTLFGEIEAVKRRAGFFMSQRRKDLDLYTLLSDTLTLCEQVEAGGHLEAMRRRVAAQPQAGRNRVYTEARSDVYVVVGRAVFEPELNRAASWRYSATLREAAKRQLRGAELGQWLRENGGINALFRARPVAARTARTKTLHLTTQVEVPRVGEVTLRLRRKSNGFFDVVSSSAPQQRELTA